MGEAINMKRILFSLAAIVGVAALAVGATGAFFNDTETSEGNIFTAGSIDLKVDHLKQTYNGEDCTTLCDTWAKEVESFAQGDRKNGSAVLEARSDETAALGPADTSGADVDPSPTGFVSLGFGGEIVLHFPNGIDDGSGDDLRIYEATGVDGYTDETISVEVSTDGSDWASIPVTPSEITFDGTVNIDLSGVTDLAYYVRITDTTDASGHNGNADGYDLDAVESLHCNNEETDGEASDIWQCQLWEETDLTNQQFFNFGDIKPGDWGTNVISLHVYDNDAYSCLLAHDGEDNENDGVGEGELQNYVTTFAWTDQDADGVYDVDDGDTSLGTSTLGNLGSIASIDGDSFLTASSTEYISLAWCAGDISVDEDTGNVDCDGAGMLDDAQSDSFSASLTAFAEQVRNNEGFSCDDIDLDEEDDDLPPQPDDLP